MHCNVEWPENPHIWQIKEEGCAPKTPMDGKGELRKCEWYSVGEAPTIPDKNKPWNPLWENLIDEVTCCGFLRLNEPQPCPPRAQTLDEEWWPLL